MPESKFTIYKFREIEVKDINRPIYLIPFGDVHRFAPMCSEEQWFNFLEWARKKRDCYFLGMGDYDDFASTKERRSLAIAGLHESTIQSIEDMMMERVNKLCGELSFMRGRLIGLIEGNHFGSFLTGVTTTQKMCEKLGCRYLGISTFVRLSFRNSGRKASIDIWAHHGKGAARLVGGSLNTVQQMAESAFADIYLMGHDHKKSAAMKTVLCLKEGHGGLKLNHKKILMARTGSFLKGYEPDCESYVARMGLSPTDLGVVKIELTPRRECKNKEDVFYVDIHTSI